MWPFVSRDRYDDLHDRYQRLLDHCQTLTEQCVAEQDARRLLACQHVDETRRLEREIALSNRRAAMYSPEETADLRRRLDLAERARATLDAQARQLQAANEAMCAELADRAKEREQPEAAS